MIRTIVLAASAIALFASAPAGAAEVRVKASGKAPAQLRTEIVNAASRACLAEVRGTGIANHVYAPCVHDAVSKATAQARSPQQSHEHRCDCLDKPVQPGVSGQTGVKAPQ